MNLLKSKGVLYLLVVLMLTVLGVFIIHQLQLKSIYFRYTVALPGIIALLFLTTKKEMSFPEFTKQFIVTKKSIKWLLLALIFYTLVSYLSTGISYLFFKGNFVLIPIFQIPLSKVWLIFVLAFFEEIGWRGYGLPILIKKTSLVFASLIVGVIWALWHFPGYLVNFGAPNDIPFILFVVWVIAASFIFTWLYIKSNYNIWTAVLLHFGANMSLQLYPIMPSIAGTSYTFYIMTLIVVIITIIIYSKKHQL
ncbi:hypothetical protein GCM10011531_26940 [Aquaticitalea lipolytica]|uniref:CAAX prenyl protease 2/Lysostaphin resistance protein A-like domain-containing protein n=1 Tax=Aquaticitalea lipolytica TaxID=1247562 RepID=A0A8J2TSP2_9FLAO|nr:CPBP family intramembrane glutamic endopeptidase [Aquaticitalea lipolytica]GFZ93588.1 hypothetical protein GCM10011531_26940 [Aquaticitalea lipolytica]